MTQSILLNITVCAMLAGVFLPVIPTQSASAENIACNCVFYARSLVPSLPRGLTTLQDKKKIINSYSPSKGSVAIIPNGDKYGHVAVVTDVSPDGKTITIKEGNWNRCKINIRKGTPQSLKVLGYFKP